MAKDINIPLRKAYYDKIAGLTYRGGNLKVYDEVVKDTDTKGQPQFYYVVLRDQTMNDSVRTKNVLSYDTTIRIDIVYGVMGDGGKKYCDEIAALILDQTVPISGTGHLQLSSNLQIVTTNVISDVTNYFSTDYGHKVWVRSIRFRHNISEN